MNIEERASRYIAGIHSVSGSGGDAAALKAALALVKGFSLPAEVAFPILMNWNATNAQPPWKPGDLRAKIRSAAKLGGAGGYLLGNRKTPEGSAFGRRPKVSAGRPTVIALGGDSDAVNRSAWPKFRVLSEESLRAIASLRNLPLTAVYWAHCAGLLKGAVVDDHRCFILTEGTFAQARRFDGQPFPLAGGDVIKAKTLAGSKGSFLGVEHLGGPACPVLLVEGAIGILEAAAAAFFAGADCAGWAVLAANSGMVGFQAPLLARLKGRHVRIVPDRDTTGAASCGKWAAQLEAAGANVDAEWPPNGAKDLGNVVANPELHRSFLLSLFKL